VTGRAVPSGSCDFVTPSSIRAGQALDVAGIAMHVWAADLPRAEALAAMVRAAPPASGPPIVEIRFEAGESLPVEWSSDDPWEVQRDEEGVVIVRSERGLAARVTPDRIVIDGNALDVGAALRPVLALALAHVLERHNRPLLHAAMLSVDDGCVLVLGHTGAGKSTVALCALRCGWPVFGDDLVVLDVHGDRISAVAVPRPIMAPRELVDDPRAAPVPGDARQRVELPPGALVLGTRPVIGVIVSTHADSPNSTVGAFSPFAVARLALASFPVSDSAESRARLFPLAVALGRLPAFELAHGTEPTTRVEDGAALLEELRSRFTA
jgi:hypothetical protein